MAHMSVDVHVFKEPICVFQCANALVIEIGPETTLNVYPTGSDMTTAELAKTLIDGLMKIAKPTIDAQTAAIAAGALE